MELLFLIVYSFLAWLVFFKYKWLPWNITTQVITVTIPFILLGITILLLNIGAPSSADVRVINHSVQILPRVTGRVIEVPVEPNRPVKKGDVLFRIDPVPFEIKLKEAKAALSQARAKLLGAQANQRGYEEQLKEVTSKKRSVSADIELAKLRVKQFKELAETGAGSHFDLEQAETQLASLNAQYAALSATEEQARAKTLARTDEGVQDEVARAKAEIEAAEAAVADAQWELDQTVTYAPADGTVVNLQLRPGHIAAQTVMQPVMTFIENAQWVVALYAQNEVREIEPGQEAEIALRMYPGRVIKCKVDSVVWATAGGQIPISGNLPNIAPMPPGQVVVRLFPSDPNMFLAAGARGQGAVYTDYVKPIQIIRRVFLRVQAKLDWLVLKLH